MTHPELHVVTGVAPESRANRNRSGLDVSSSSIADLDFRIGDDPGVNGATRLSRTMSECIDP